MLRIRNLLFLLALVVLVFRLLPRDPKQRLARRLDELANVLIAVFLLGWLISFLVDVLS